MGARGNSGVIFSQILTGFAKGLAGCETIDAAALVAGFNGGVQSAYKAVSNPMEGTILTVVREAAEALSAQYKKGMDILECLRIISQRVTRRWRAHRSFCRCSSRLALLTLAAAAISM